MGVFGHFLRLPIFFSVHFFCTFLVTIFERPKRSNFSPIPLGLASVDFNIFLIYCIYFRTPFLWKSQQSLIYSIFCFCVCPKNQNFWNAPSDSDYEKVVKYFADEKMASKLHNWSRKTGSFTDSDAMESALGFSELFEMLGLGYHKRRIFKSMGMVIVLLNVPLGILTTVSSNNPYWLFLTLLIDTGFHALLNMGWGSEYEKCDFYRYFFSCVFAVIHCHHKFIDGYFIFKLKGMSLVIGHLVIYLVLSCWDFCQVEITQKWHTFL